MSYIVEVVASDDETTSLQCKPIPGGYGLPIIGPIIDRLNYFYFEGPTKFFTSRAEKYQSTVFRVNMPPGPFIARNSQVIVLLDAISFPVLFDSDKVEKKDVFTGTFMPSLCLTGDYRVLSYLDPSEPKHTKLKSLVFSLLCRSKDKVLPEFHTAFTQLFNKLDTELSAGKGKAGFNALNEQACFNFLCKCFYDTNPVDTKLGDNGPKMINKWLLWQLSPLLSNLGLPWCIEDNIFHMFPFPPSLVQSEYTKLHNFFKDNVGAILDQAEVLGISIDEATHNLLFATCFNTYGGMRILFASILKWVGNSRKDLQPKLMKEIRASVVDGKVTLGSLEKMELTKSVVYEVLRMDPPVPAQYGKVKEDMVLESRSGNFKVKKGEMLFGLQPFATRDQVISGRPGNEFVPDRFVGDGKTDLEFVWWSNGPETGRPVAANKQCPGKDFVILVSRLFLAEFFLRYDSFEVKVDGESALGASLTFTSLVPTAGL